jgi:hypothetical protein
VTPTNTVLTRSRSCSSQHVDMHLYYIAIKIGARMALHVFTRLSKIKFGLNHFRGLEHDQFSFENTAYDFNHYSQWDVPMLILKTDLDYSSNYLCFNNLIFYFIFLLRMTFKKGKNRSYLQFKFKYIEMEF